MYANAHSGAMSPATIETIESDAGVYPRTVACQELQVRLRLLAVTNCCRRKPG